MVPRSALRVQEVGHGSECEVEPVDPLIVMARYAALYFL